MWMAVYPLWHAVQLFLRKLHSVGLLLLPRILYRALATLSLARKRPATPLEGLASGVVFCMYTRIIRYLSIVIISRIL
ncbi:hypothetical protein [Circoviridae sp.]|nr:hypothetical protein [Circoviridae sp.]